MHHRTSYEHFKHYCGYPHFNKMSNKNTSNAFKQWNSTEKSEYVSGFYCEYFSFTRNRIFLAFTGIPDTLIAIAKEMRWKILINYSDRKIFGERDRNDDFSVVGLNFVVQIFVECVSYVACVFAHFDWW